MIPKNISNATTDLSGGADDILFCPHSKIQNTVF
jgi:hypothetical protein